MERSLYYPLIQEGLNTLKVRYDRFTDKEYITAAKEWDSDIKWTNFNRTFFADSLLTSDDIRLSDKETRAIFAKYNLSDYLDEVFALLRKGKFFGLDCYYYDKKDIRFTANLHYYDLCINNHDHARYTGGIRRHDRHETEMEVILDGLNLGRVQTYKNVLSGLKYGGGKITVVSDPVDLEDKEELAFLSYALEKVRFFTGPDMRYPVELADCMSEFSGYIQAGMKNNPIGPSGGPTSLGVHAAMKEAIKVHFNKDDGAKDMTVAIMGLGAVGYPMAEYLIADGAKLIVADIDPESAKSLKAKYPDASIEVVDVKDILLTDAEILCPCAIGGVITEAIIPQLKAKMVIGGANNQLDATNTQEEIRLSKMLQDRGILYQECWIMNIGGVMTGAELYRNGADADKDGLFERILDICPKITATNLKEAKEKGITPNENAIQMIEKRIYG